MAAYGENLMATHTERLASCGNPVRAAARGAMRSARWLPTHRAINERAARGVPGLLRCGVNGGLQAPASCQDAGVHRERGSAAVPEPECRARLVLWFSYFPRGK
jgi:hypothetical protein